MTKKELIKEELIKILDGLDLKQLTRGDIYNKIHKINCKNVLKKFPTYSRPDKSIIYENKNNLRVSNSSIDEGLE
ncbi:hypothetical protein ACJDU8_25275 [Clostridium sp. WILCCON 0269]|uniref:Uncharacterized protein n=1 Tax=Candidatus Clostridium eludens TaxID=3381663 RepID=A0ABW8SS21_9CLOT